MELRSCWFKARSCGVVRGPSTGFPDSQALGADAGSGRAHRNLVACRRFGLFYLNFLNQFTYGFGILIRGSGTDGTVCSPPRRPTTSGAGC